MEVEVVEEMDLDVERSKLVAMAAEALFVLHWLSGCPQRSLFPVYQSITALEKLKNHMDLIINYLFLTRRYNKRRRSRKTERKNKTKNRNKLGAQTQELEPKNRYNCKN